MTKPPFFDVLLQSGELLVGHRPEARLGHVGDRAREELGIVEREDVALVEMRLEERDLLQDAHEVPLGARIVVRPRRLAPEVLDAVPQPDEGETAVVRRLLAGDRRHATSPRSRDLCANTAVAHSASTIADARRALPQRSRTRRTCRTRRTLGEPHRTPITPLRAQQADQQHEDDRQVPQVALLDRRHAAAGVAQVLGQPLHASGV